MRLRRLFRTIGLSAFTISGLAFAPACAAPEEGDDEDVGTAASAAASSADELAFVDQAYARFVAGATTATYAPLRNTAASPGSRYPERDLSSYYRTTCSLALVGAVYARAHGTAPTDTVKAWLREAIADYSRFAEEKWGYHVRLAPAVDCLLAASVAKDSLSVTDRQKLKNAVATVTNAARTPAEFRSIGKGNAADSQAEESALAADFLYLASRLAGENATQRAGWRERSEALFRYAASIPRKEGERISEWEGEPFRRKRADGGLLGADENVVTNHGLETSPYYSLGALISYADATAIARGFGEKLPPGVREVRTTFNEKGSSRIREQLGVREIFAGSAARLDQTTFGFKGGYRLIDGGKNVPMDYGSQTMTIPSFLPGSDLVIPTAGTGTVSEFFDPVDGKIKGYQVDGDEMRAFECADEARGWFCRARYKSKLSGQWSTANVAEQQLWSPAIPKTNVDALVQWVNPTNAIVTDVFSGNRVWRYTCSGTPRRCTANDSVDLATHFQRHGFSSSSMPPTDRVDAASSFIHVDGSGRRYWIRGNRIWRARCNADFTGCSVASDTLAGQFAGLAFVPALPTDRVDSLAQLVKGGVLHSYVFRGDRVWKYECTTTGCAPKFTQLIADQWRGITNQERWADGALATLRGVTDWGVQPTMMNATFALASYVGGDSGAYGRLVARQRDVLKLATQPLFPTTFDSASGRFGYGPFVNAQPVGTYGPIWALQDGWTPNHIGPRERLNSFTWFNAFAARNHAVAYMLTRSQPLVTSPLL